jgi:hypothetical protein
VSDYKRTTTRRSSGRKTGVSKLSPIATEEPVVDEFCHVLARILRRVTAGQGDSISPVE